MPAASRAAAGNPPSVMTIVLLIVIIAGALALTYDLSVHASRASRSETGPPTAPPDAPGDDRPAASPPKEQL